VAALDAPVVLRPAVLADIPALQDIEVDAGRQFADAGLDAVATDAPPSAEGLTAHITAGSAWVAETGGAVVGYAVTSIVDGEAHLDQISVRPQMRGRRVGRTLIDEAVRWARHLGLPSMTLTTFADVPWNAPYYAQLGFRVLAPHEIGPQLAAVRDSESWLDALAPRVAMRLVVV
jgi:GNAT superfamily N-acetyltransferase